MLSLYPYTFYICGGWLMNVQGYIQGHRATPCWTLLWEEAGKELGHRGPLISTGPKWGGWTASFVPWCPHHRGSDLGTVHSLSCEKCKAETVLPQTPGEILGHAMQHQTTYMNIN